MRETAAEVAKLQDFIDRSLARTRPHTSASQREGPNAPRVRLDFTHMAIDRSVVEKAAGLARIALTPDEVERFTGQLSVVLQAVARLSEVDTERVSPTASVLPVSNVMREDEIRPGLSRDDALANAPKGGRDGEFFRVQQVLEERP